jgi:hypothetical protein
VEGISTSRLRALNPLDLCRGSAGAHVGAPFFFTACIFFQTKVTLCIGGACGAAAPRPVLLLIALQQPGWARFGVDPFFKYQFFSEYPYLSLRPGSKKWHWAGAEFMMVLPFSFFFEAVCLRDALCMHPTAHSHPPFFFCKMSFSSPQSGRSAQAPEGHCAIPPPRHPSLP